MFGYYVEVTNINLHLVPDSFERRQTLVNAERFITPQLKDLESGSLIEKITFLILLLMIEFTQGGVLP